MRVERPTRGRGYLVITEKRSAMRQHSIRVTNGDRMARTRTIQRYMWRMLLAGVIVPFAVAGAVTGPLVQRGTAVIANGTATTTITLGTAVDRAHSFVACTFVSTSVNPSDALVRWSLSAAGDQVIFTRAATTLTSDTIQYQVTTHPDLTVQQVSASLAVGTATSNTAIAPVSAGNSFIIVSWTSDNTTGANMHDSYCTAYFTTQVNPNDNVLVARGSTTTLGNLVYNIQVVSWAGATVQTNDYVQNNGISSSTVALASSVPLGNSFVFRTTRNQDADQNAAGQGFINADVYFTSSNQLGISRLAAGTGAIVVRWWVVTLPFTAVVQENNFNSIDDITINLARSIDTAKTFIMPNMSSSGTGTVWTNFWAMSQLTGPSTIFFNRFNNTGQTSNGYVYTVQLPDTNVVPRLFDTAGSASSLKVYRCTNGDDTVRIFYQVWDDSNYVYDTVKVQYRNGSSGAWTTLTNAIGDIGPVSYPSDSALHRCVRWYTAGQLPNTESDSIGLRVIATDLPGTSDTLAMAADGLLVDTRDPLGMASFRVTDSSSRSVGLAWTPVASEGHFGHYEIWYGQVQADVESRSGSALQWDQTRDGSLAAKSASATTIAGLTPATRFYFKIWASDSCGNEVTLSTIATTTLNTIAPVVTGWAPDLNVDVVQFSPDSIRIGYQVADIDDDTVAISSQYELQGGPWQDLTTNMYGDTGRTKTSLSAKDTVLWDIRSAFGLDKDSSCLVRIIANDGTHRDTALSFGFVIDTRPPQNLTNLRHTDSSYNSVSLAWNPVTESHFDHYEVWYGNNRAMVENRSGASKWDQNSDANLSNKALAFTRVVDLFPNKKYYFKVWAIDAFGYESASGVDSCTTQNGVLPWNDDFESGASSWSGGALSTTYDHTAGGLYSLKLGRSGMTQTILDLSLYQGSNDVNLRVFYRNLGTWAATDQLFVEINNSGSWTQMTTRSGDQPGWLQIDVPLSAVALTSNFGIRFRSSTNSNTKVFYVDDVEITGSLPTVPKLTGAADAPFLSAVQRTDGSKLVAIQYLTGDNEKTTVSITGDYRAGSGAWTAMNPAHCSGEAGSGVQGTRPDSLRAFLWNAGLAVANVEASNYQLRLTANDGGGGVFDSTTTTMQFANLQIDTKNPVVATPIHFSGAPVAGTGFTLDAGFTEANPGSNTYFYNLNGGGFDAGTVGDANVADPAAKTISLAINGGTYFSGIKCVHVDRFGNSTASQDLTAVYVKPYTPLTPAASNPTTSTLDITLVPNPSEAAGLQYAIYEVTSGKWVQQSGGALGASASWAVMGTAPGQWGQASGVAGRITVTGLSAPISQYSFKVKSRNSRDNSTESDFSVGSQNSPSVGGYAADSVIPAAQVVQATNGSGLVTVTFRIKDAEGDAGVLQGFQYSDDGGTTWYAPSNGDGSAALGGGWPSNGGAKFSSAVDWSGIAHTFVFNTKHADVSAAHTLATADIALFRLRFKINDGLNVSAYATSQNGVLDNAPAVPITPIRFLAVPAAGSDIVLDAAFTESHPAANTFYYNYNGSGYDAGTAGQSAIGDPAPQSIPVSMNGAGYFGGIKCVHVDAFGNIEVSENTANVYVKPFTPATPTVANPTSSTVDLTIIPHPLEASGLAYAIYEETTGKWVRQSDGSLVSGIAWALIGTAAGTWGQASGVGGKITITGLSSPVSHYSFRVKSRNSVDNITESDLSSGASSVNSGPNAGYATDNVIPAAEVVQSTDGNGIITITFKSKDAQQDPVTLQSFQFSDNGGGTWYTPTNGDASGALAAPWPNNGGSLFSSAVDWSGAVHSFTFNTKHPDVTSAYPLLATDIRNFRVRFEVTDGLSSAALATSANQTLDNKAPVVSVPVHFASAPVAGSSVTLEAAFTETNPNTNTFFINLNGAGYNAGTAGAVNVADPPPTAISVPVAGSDYIGAIKCVHVDDFGNTTVSENTTAVFVKPYTPDAPTVSSPSQSTVNVTVNKYAAEAAGLSYAIYEATTGRYVQAAGNLGAAPAWQTQAAWGSKTVTGLNSPVSQYIFKVKSRNSADNATESDLSAGAQILNTAPIIGYGSDNVVPASQVTEATDASGLVTVSFRVKDAQSDLVSLSSFQYSDDGGTNWYSPANGDGSAALGGSWPNNGGSKFSSAADWSGTVYSFTLNTKHPDVTAAHALTSANTNAFRVRFKANDAAANSAFGVSDNSVLDNLAPAVATPVALTSSPLAGSGITIDVAFTEVNPKTNTYYYDLNGTGFDAGTAGDPNTADPAPKDIALTLTGADYINAVKAVHVDAYGNTTTSVNFSKAYVKPYTPPPPDVNNPTATSVDVTVNKQALEAAGLECAIYEVSSGKYVKSNGTLGPSAVWQSQAIWGTKSVTGLTSPVSQYGFKVKSRSSADNITESDLSTAGAIVNSAPIVGYAADNVIPAAQVSQSVDGQGVITVTFRLKDAQQDLLSLQSFEYSDNGGITWYAPLNGDASAALGGSWPNNGGAKFIASVDWSGSAYAITFNTKHVDVAGSHSLSTADVGNFRIRFKAFDGAAASASGVSDNHKLDNAVPVVTSAIAFSPAAVAGASFALDAGFSETNPSANTFFYKLNGAGYDAGTAGDAGIADPSPKSIAIAVDGNDYFTGIKCVHLDQLGNSTTSENLSTVYVQPYTPPAPTVGNATGTTVDVTVNKAAAEAAGLSYAIYEVATGKYVQAGGTLGATAVWQTQAAWGTKTVSGLSSPVTQYSFKVKSRNSSDNFTESVLSSAASSGNSPPVGGYTADDIIPAAQVALATDGSGVVTISFRAKDGQANLVTLESFAYSDNGGATWYTALNGDASGSLTGTWPNNGGSKFSSALDWSGAPHAFSFNSRHADVAGSHSLSSTSVANFRVRFKLNDGTSQSNYVVSDNQVLDNIAPVTATAIHFAPAPVSGGSITLGASFTEGNPGTNTFYYNLNGTGYDPGSAGDANTATPADKAISVTIKGCDKFVAVKCVHTDKFGNSCTTESIADVYVKPYTPSAPTVASPTSSSLTVAVNAAASEAAGLSYAISEVSTNQYVQADGTLGASAVWQTTGSWGSATVNGLSSPVSQYSFKTKSRNSADNATESDLSPAGAVSNSAPFAGYAADNVVPAAQVVQSTDGSGLVTVTFRAKDSQRDLVTLQSFEYSDDGGISWFAPVNGDASAALGGSWPANGGSKYTSAADWSGAVYSFTFSTRHTNVTLSHSLTGISIATFRVRFKVGDGLSTSSFAVSDNQVLDNLAPQVATSIHLVSAPVAGSPVSLDAAFTENNPYTNSYYYNLDGAGYGAGIPGDTNVADPAAKAIPVALTGADYFDAIKCVHTDKYGNTATSENTANIYVKPFTPPAPTVSNPTLSSVDIMVNKQTAEVAGLSYAVYEVLTGKYVQLDGTLGTSAVWQTISTWGTKTVSGLSAPVLQYGFKTKSRNSADNSTESALSSSASIVNSAPSVGYTADNLIPAPSQATNGSGRMTVQFRVRDAERDPIALQGFQYSDDGGLNWYTPTNGDASASLSVGWADNGGAKYGSAPDWNGSLYSLTFNTKHADVTGIHSLSATTSATFRVRFKASDGLATSAYAVSDNSILDNVAPGVSVNALLTKDQTPLLNGAVNDNAAAVTVTVEGQTKTATNNGDGTWTLADNQLSTLSEGVHDVLVTATDAAGNIGTDATSNELVIDISAPSSPSISITDAMGFTNNATPGLVLSAVNADSMRFQVNGEGWGAWEGYATAKSNLSISGAGDGLKKVYVEYRDLAGNVSSAVYDSTLYDATAPSTPTIAISDNQGFTNNATPDLVLSAVNADSMRFQVNAEGWSAWEPYATAKGNLSIASTGEGLKKVSVEYRDRAGNVSAAVSDSTVYDATAPSSPTIAISDNQGYTKNATPDLALSAMNADSMRFQVNAEGWSAWEAYATAKNNLSIASTGEGLKKVYVEYRDRAGNSTAAVSDSTTYDVTAPLSPSIVIAGSQGYTNSATLSLVLSAVNADSMRFQVNAEGWGAWEAYATAKSNVNIGASGDGLKKVYAEFRDAAGNLGSVVSDSTILDRAAPVPVSLVITDISGFTADAHPAMSVSATGADSMAFRLNGGAWTSYIAYATSYSAIDVSTGGEGLKRISVKFKDRVGNESDGLLADSTTFDATPPFGAAISITDNGGYTNSTTPALVLSVIAADSMRFEVNAEGWSAWGPFATSKNNLTISGTGEGLKKISVEYKDFLNRVSETVSDSTVYDVTAPSAVSISITDNFGYTNHATPALALGATGADSMAFKLNGGTWSAFEPFATSKTTLDISLGGEGLKKVYVRFRDLAGNVTDGSLFDSTIYDSTAPSLPSIVIANNQGFTRDSTPNLTLFLQVAPIRCVSR